MKRCYLGVGVLLVLLLFGIFSSRWMKIHHSRLEKQMLEAAQMEPEALLVRTRQVSLGWNRGFTAMLADHQYLERAELAFDHLRAAANAGDRAECTRLCLEIAHIFRVLAEDQRMKWENLL